MDKLKPFQPITNDRRGSVADDKLTPSSEMHILIGGPYKQDGEEHRYGHTALRIKSARGDLTYDFGRYGDTWGPFDESGDGILRVWSVFNSYIKDENALGRSTTGFVYAIFDHQALATMDFFSSLIANGQYLARKDKLHRKSYKLNFDYHALAPNCTTLSMDGAKKAIENIDSGSEKYNKPEDVLTTMERLLLSSKGGSKRLFLPANPQVFLSSGSPVKSIRIDKYGR